MHSQILRRLTNLFRFMYTLLVILERCRSGHNEAVLKTVSPTGHMGSNPILSAKAKARKQAKNGLYACFFYVLCAEKPAATDGKAAKIGNTCNTNATQKKLYMQHDFHTAVFATHAVSPVTYVHNPIFSAEKARIRAVFWLGYALFSIVFNQSHRKFSCASHVLPREKPFQALLLFQIPLLPPKSGIREAP